MSRYDDINPMDMDPDTGRPYSNYSSPSLDTSFHDGEMDVAETVAEAAMRLLERLGNICDNPPRLVQEAADALSEALAREGL